MPKVDHRVNKAIQAREVRVIGEDGKQLGIMPTHIAVRIAEEKGLVRAGRGQVSDAEIRAEGLNLVMGTTPGIIAIIG